MEPAALSNRRPAGLCRHLLLVLSVSLAVCGVLAVAVLFHAQDREDAAAAAPPPPVTRKFDCALKNGSMDLPLDQPPMAKAVGELEPEQIHLALGGDPGSMVVSWATHNASTNEDEDDFELQDAGVQRPDNTSVASLVQYGRSPDWLESTAQGAADSYIQVFPGHTYVSGLFHHAKLSGLLPATTYYYRCGDPEHGWSARRSFTTLAAPTNVAWPQRIGLIGDLGQTHNSSSTLHHLMANDPPVVILLGDFAYADHYRADGSAWRGAQSPTARGLKDTAAHMGVASLAPFTPSYQPRWDSWGRFVEPLFARVPLMAVEGNHEEEADAQGRRWQAYSLRYRFPYAASGSPSPLYYSFDLPGKGAHVVMLGAYAQSGGAYNWSADPTQAAWLKADLASVDRGLTPWLLVVMHPPWYNTYEAHYKEFECMRLAIEPMLYAAGVDMVFAGHVHAYERNNRVYNYSTNACAPMHITLGDGGNVERMYVKWVDLYGCCPPEDKRPPCATLQDGQYCPSTQPPWSAYREPSFGHAILSLDSPTRATFTWHRNQDGASVAADTVVIERNAACANQKAPRE